MVQKTPAGKEEIGGRVDRKRPGRRGLVSASLSLLLICLLAVLAMAASDQATTTITGNVVDNIPPAAVTDLAVTSPSYTSLTLTWTAPGDDGNLGTAAEYDIRYSTSTITDANWGSATQCSGEPTPQPAGSTESFIVTGLSPGTRYYFALKTADEVLNWSGLSNIASGTTSGGEVGPPSPPRYWLKVNLVGKVATVETSETGVLQEAAELTSPDGVWTLEMPNGTKVLTADRKRATSIVAEDATGLIPPSGSTIIKAIDFTPAGITSTPPVTLKYSYEQNDIPEGVPEESLVIACYDGATGEWIKLESIVDTEANTVTAKISRFNDLAVLVYKAEVPAPAAFKCSSLSISPTEVDIGEAVNITVLVANTGAQSGDYQVILKINGVVEAESEVALDAGASEQVGFTTSKDAAGTYSVDVNGLTGTFQVKQMSVPPPVEPTPAKPISRWLIVGIIAAAAVAALLTYIFLTQRRYAVLLAPSR